MNRQYVGCVVAFCPPIPMPLLSTAFTTPLEPDAPCMTGTNTVDKACKQECDRHTLTRPTVTVQVERCLCQLSRAYRAHAVDLHPAAPPTLLRPSGEVITSALSTSPHSATSSFSSFHVYDQGMPWMHTWAPGQAAHRSTLLINLADCHPARRMLPAAASCTVEQMQPNSYALIPSAKS